MRRLASLLVIVLVLGMVGGCSKKDSGHDNHQHKPGEKHDH